LRKKISDLLSLCLEFQVFTSHVNVSATQNKTLKSLLYR